MAKSLRAKTKVRNRGIKRDKIFAPAELARTVRLSKKLTGGNNGSEIMIDTDEIKNDSTEVIEGTEMTVDSESNTKQSISTSGWKGSRNEQWKQKKASKRSTKKRLGNRALVFPSKKNKK
ncbi:hypothetical protein V1511DRAFT_498628 [Dipodascopsis uninucleata]